MQLGVELVGCGGLSRVRVRHVRLVPFISDFAGETRADRRGRIERGGGGFCLGARVSRWGNLEGARVW